MEQKNRTDFLQGQDGEEKEIQEHSSSDGQDMLEKLKCKADELKSSGYTVFHTTKLLMREALDLLYSYNSEYKNLGSLYAHLDEWHKERIVNWGTSEYMIYLFYFVIW